MAALTGALVAIDVAIGALNVVSKVQSMLMIAQSEGRDVTPEELDALRAVNEELYTQIQENLNKAKNST